MKMLDVGLGAVSGLLLSVGVDLEHPRDLTFSTRRMSVIDTDASLRAIERSNLGYLGLQRSRKRAAIRARFRVREQVGVGSYDNDNSPGAPAAIRPQSTSSTIISS